MSAAPARRDHDPELFVCSVCGLEWRRADDCTTPNDCNWIRETGHGPTRETDRR